MLNADSDETKASENSAFNIQHSAFSTFYFAMTHFSISPMVADLPCIRRPVRKILPAAHTMATAAHVMLTTDTATCHIGGPGCREIRSSIRNGAAVGTSERTVAIVPSGARSTAPAVNTGIMTRSITGVIMFCESFRSLQAAPMATNSDPKMNCDRTTNKKNQPMIEGVTAA